MSRDEHVLAVPTADLLAGRPLQGLAAGGGAFLDFIFEPAHTRFLPRAAAELDPAWKQIIPYVLLHSGGQLLLYRRGKASTETRLVALHSVGVGGHIRNTDESFFAAPGWEAYQQAVRREVEEEVAIAPGNLRRDRIVGVINDDSVEVGRVHFGVVHIWDLERPEVEKREAKIVAPRFVPLAELAGAAAPPLETWSQLCVAHWRQLEAAAGWRPAR